MYRFSAIMLAALLGSGVAFAHNHAHHQHAHQAMPSMASASDLVLSQCWVRFRPDNTSAIYLNIANQDPHQDAYIVGASSPAFADLMIHETYEQEGMAGMRHTSKVQIPAGGSLMFKPGGYHVMANQAHQLKVGDEVPVMFKLSNGIEVSTQCVIKPFSARSYNG